MKRRAFLVGAAAAGAAIPLSSIAAASATLGLSEPSKRRTATCYQLYKDEYGTVWNLCRDYGAFYPKNNGQLVLEAQHLVFGRHLGRDCPRDLVCEYGMHEQVESPFDDAATNRHYDARPLRERVLGSQSWFHRRLKWNLMSKGYIPYHWADHDAPPRPTTSFEDSVSAEVILDFANGKFRGLSKSTITAYIKKRWPVPAKRAQALTDDIRTRVLLLAFRARYQEKDAVEFARRHFYSIHEAGRFGQRSLDP